MYQLHGKNLIVTLTEQGTIYSLESKDSHVLFSSDEIRLKTDYGFFSTKDAAVSCVKLQEDEVSFCFKNGIFNLFITYLVHPQDSFCRRYIRMENSVPLSLYHLTTRHEMDLEPIEVLDYQTFWNCPTVGFIRYVGYGMYTGFENPFFQVKSDGRRVETAFEPALLLQENEGYTSEANFFGIYTASGQVIQQQIPPTTMRYNDVCHTRYRNPCGHIALDKAEIEAFQEYAREYLQLRVDQFKLIFYQFFITLPQQPSTDEEEQVYYHYIDNFVKIGGDLVTFNPLVRNVPPAPDGADSWNLAPSGSRAERILNYARKKGLEIGFYMGSAAGNSAYYTSPMTPFALENKPQWKKRDRDGHCSSENCIASDDFAAWFYEVQHNTIQKYGITLWDWDPGPGNGFFCYSSEHGHIPGKGAYKGFRNAMGIVERLKKDFSNLYIQGFHGTKEYGLWGFRGFDQHECYWEQDPFSMASAYPDYSEDRLTAGGMRFQSAWNQLFRFMPPETNHALSSRMTQYCLSPQNLRKLYDQRGWKYAFFSALAVGASMTVTMMPEFPEKISNGEYLDYFQKWIPWARKNFALARYSKPFGSQPACGTMDGFARIHNGHGFLFLFNPSPIEIKAHFELGEEIGLKEEGSYNLVWLYPLEQTLFYDQETQKANFSYGDQIHVCIPPYENIILELHSEKKNDNSPYCCNFPGKLVLRGKKAEITDCRGRDGECLKGTLVHAGKVERLTINGNDIPFIRNGDDLSFEICFGTEQFPEVLGTWEENGKPFKPMDHCGGQHTIKTHFSVPAALQKRLETYLPEDLSAHEKIIAEMKEKMQRESFAWARPYCLHLMFPFAYPDHVKGLSAELNGQKLKLELTDSWHDSIQAKLLYYADITETVCWDADNVLIIHADHMDKNTFLGVRLDYPEGMFTENVNPARKQETLFSSAPIGLPRQQRPLKKGERWPIVQNAWVVDGIIYENKPYTLCASINLPPEELEGVYASAQISIDDQSKTSLRADQRLDFDSKTGLWKRELLPGSRKLLIIDGKDIHVWAVSKTGTVSPTFQVPVEWHLQAY